MRGSDLRFDSCVTLDGKRNATYRFDFLRGLANYLAAASD
jgi:hypothetical protein